MDLEEIRRLLDEGRYEFSLHAQQERLEENIDIAEIEEAVLSQGEILEEYPDDPRGESCLILGLFRPNLFMLFLAGQEESETPLGYYE